ncbi:NADH:ubiquinone oxidoreductase subunit F (NADH-binding) [Prescottella agglutinans]|uniref:NADH:ubiquinone oxidoreductase subunit F (NADH-binding) n=1 Tax=Prescottella agglutinans TaxID=1644129 RepID=A0ABT6MH46_9NOCA|nr:NADH:ubiquinone oxidoreductase subunit F (NADH-binding) [Prescottella agglutinans]
MNRHLFSSPAADFDSHTATFGPLPECPHRGVLTGELAEAGLAGRGGAGFPTADKLAAISGRRTVVIGNGAEGEPLSDKDAVLLTHAPHLVIDGLVLAAREVGSREVYLYADDARLPNLEHALSQRLRADSRDPEVRLIAAPGGFVSGEKSSIVNRIGGGPAVPLDRRSHLSESGLRGRPTLVGNVETFAHLAMIARYGARWFRARGMNGAAGTMLVTLSGNLRSVGVVEVPMGISLHHLLTEYAGTDPRALRAVLAGGYHGGWITPAGLHSTILTPASLAPYGASPGAGVIHGLGVERCGLRAAAGIVRYLSQQSARQCGPCINGLPRIAESLENLALGHSVHTHEQELLFLTDMVNGRGACRHPDGTVRLVRSSLRAFASDVRQHSVGRCEAGLRANRFDLSDAS